jgi:hypothetical protein
VIEIDPDKTLDELVELGDQLADSRDKEQAEELLSQIIEKALDLRDWISNGGFMPDVQASKPEEATFSESAENGKE